MGVYLRADHPTITRVLDKYEARRQCYINHPDIDELPVANRIITGSRPAPARQLVQAIYWMLQGSNLPKWIDEQRVIDAYSPDNIDDAWEIVSRSSSPSGVMAWNGTTFDALDIPYTGTSAHPLITGMKSGTVAADTVVWSPYHYETFWLDLEKLLDAMQWWYVPGWQPVPESGAIREMAKFYDDHLSDAQIRAAAEDDWASAAYSSPYPSSGLGLGEKAQITRNWVDPIVQVTVKMMYGRYYPSLPGDWTWSDVSSAATIAVDYPRYYWGVARLLHDEFNTMGNTLSDNVPQSGRVAGLPRYFGFPASHSDGYIDIASSALRDLPEPFINDHDHIGYNQEWEGLGANSLVKFSFEST